MSNKDGTQPPSDEDNNEESAQTQPPKLEVVSAKHSYDKAAIQGFIDLVFHTQPHGAEIAAFAPRTGNMPGFPVDGLNTFDKILSGSKPRALYYSTASLYRQTDGMLRNKLANFAGLHVIVLDDIGTKIDPADLPAGLATPTYIIESSDGNYQYGYVLEQPVMDQDEAQALVNMVKHHEPRITDKGGVLLGKAVRLPDGVNGKKGEKGRFHVKLVDDTGPLFPADVLKRELEAGQPPAGAQTPRTATYKRLYDVPDFGTPPDEVVDFLYAQGMVLHNDPNQSDFISIECPWGAGHSTPDVCAGYSPLGVGEGDYKYSRGFNCFHDSCSAHTTPDFLNYVARNAPAIKALAQFVPPEAQIPNDKYVLSTAKSGGYFNMNAKPPIEGQLGGLKQKHYTDVWTVNGAKDGKGRYVNAVDYWAATPHPTRVAGLHYEVGESSVLEHDGDLYANTYTAPEWTDGSYDVAAVQKFIDYINYLLPEDGEADYFLDWLAAKVQDPRFRGTAILMLTDGTQGVGRTTLSKYVGDIMGEWNTASIQFDQMVKDSFNEWVTSLMVIVNEVKDSDSRDYRKMEALKNYVDSSPVKVAVNVKNGFKGSAETCASFLMFSNHVDALKVAREDRRFTVLRNPDVPDPVMTEDMATWRLNETATPYNAEDLYRYFRQRDITSDLYRPLKTVAGEAMRLETKGTTDRLVDAIARACEQENLLAVPASEIDGLIGGLFGRLQMDTPDDPKTVYRRVKKEYFAPALSNVTSRVHHLNNGNAIKPRFVKGVSLGVPEAMGIRRHGKVKTSDLSTELAKRINADLHRFDADLILGIAEDLLSD